MEEQDAPEINVVIVETAYLCGARIGFAAKNVEDAAAAAARIMTDVCPECKERLGEELSDRDKEILSMAPDYNKPKDN